MSEKTKINWTLGVQIIDGPKISATQVVLVDAYDKIDVVVPKKEDTTTGSATVDIQPGGPGQVQFLLIRSDEYSDDLKYTVNDGTDDGVADVQLDAQQLFIGDGAVGLLKVAPVILKFSNDLDVDASVQIIVGRNATT